MAQQVAQRPDTQDMILVHRVFRREFRLAPQEVRSVAAGDLDRARTVVAHLVEMVTMLHHHHTGEDELLWPRLQQRAELSADLLARMETQHAQVSALLDSVAALLPRFAQAADAPLRDELAAVLTAVSEALDAHLAQEEREVLPLVEEHLTVAEWAELGERGMAGIPKPRLLVILGHILEEATEQERAVFLGHVPAPARLAYAVVGRRKHAKEVAALRRGIALPAQREG